MKKGELFHSFVNSFLKISLLFMIVISFLNERFIPAFLVVLNLAIVLIPSFFRMVWKIKIPLFADTVLSFIFFWQSIGTTWAYANIFWWDEIAHTVDLFLANIAIFMVVIALNDIKKIRVSLKFATIFVICFGITLGVLFEIIEFLGDIFIFIPYRELPAQQEGLYDTMKDLIFNVFSSSFGAIVGYNLFKNKKSWFISSINEFKEVFKRK